MNQLNSLILEGNVVRQAELTEPVKGFKVCKFPMAVNRYLKKSNGEGVEEVSYFDVEAYGKVAEICEKNSSKGRGIRVVGRLKQNRWKDDSGKSLSKVFVVAEHIEFKPKLNYKTQDESTQSENQEDEVSEAQTESNAIEELEEESVF